MDQGEYVQQQKRKYMAQVLELFDESILPQLPTSAAGEVQAFKGQVRAKLNALAKDATDIFCLDPGAKQNGFAIEARVNGR